MDRPPIVAAHPTQSEERNMTSNRLRGLVLIVLLAVVGAGCGDEDPTRGFSEEVRAGYMEGCLQSGNRSFCDCTLEEFEQTFSQAEFERLALGFAGDEPPPQEFLDVITACLEQIEGAGD
jgi:hypothetical protein